MNGAKRVNGNGSGLRASRQVIGLLGLLTATVLFGCSRADGPETADSEPAAASELDPSGAEALEEKPPGPWRVAKTRRGSESEELDETALQRLKALEAVGYLGGYSDVPDLIGVTRYDPERAFNGHNLIISGHAQEATLVDMEGKVVHTWAYDGCLHYPIGPYRRFWRRAHLAKNGVLYAVCDPHGIIKIDKDSELIWATPGGYYLHHDLCVAENGRVYALGKVFHLRPELHPDKEVIGDLVVTIDDTDGKVLDSFEIFEAFAQTEYREQIATLISEFSHKTRARKYEDFHTNTIEWLDGSHASVSDVLKRGNILNCSPYRHVTWILDPERRAVVWCWFGPWKDIHEVTFTDAGTFMLFHNGGYEGPNGRVSQVLEYDFASREERWRYQGDPSDPDSEFRSATSSLATRLPNGNTLIVVTESGRAIEVTSAGDIVWEYFNPKRAGAKNEFIASLFQVVRIPVEDTATWLD